MKSFSSKKLLIVIFCIVAVGAISVAFFAFQKKETIEPEVSIDNPLSPEVWGSERKVIGFSAEGREIESYTFGKGEKKLFFVGGIHGGYEWNSVVLAYRFVDYFEESSDSVPDGLRVTVIPSLNPDGVFKIIKKEGRFEISDVPSKGSKAEGRFNARGVDLNRNFDCKWKPEGLWGTRKVNCGTGPFSEPESAALKDFILENNPGAVIFWHSQSNGVYASLCHDDILQETRDIMNAYSKASGYPPYDTFDQYEVTGDASDWLASIGIPAISIELKTRETIEWEQNLAGIEAVFKYYADKK